MITSGEGQSSVSPIESEKPGWCRETGGEPRIERVGQELLDTFLGMTSEEAARVARSEGLACRLRNEEDPKELVSANWSSCRGESVAGQEWQSYTRRRRVNVSLTASAATRPRSLHRQL